jgi:hypothetical protein
MAVGGYNGSGSRIDRRSFDRSQNKSVCIVLGGRKRVSKQKRHWNASITSLTELTKKSGDSSASRSMFEFFGLLIWATKNEFENLSGAFLNCISKTLGFKSWKHCCSSHQSWVAMLK